MTTALTTTEHQKYLECNAVIEHGLQTFFDVGTALMVVRNDRLYREEYGTFEDYCQQKWGWTRQRANQLIASADVVAISDTPRYSCCKHLRDPSIFIESHDLLHPRSFRLTIT